MREVPRHKVVATSLCAGPHRIAWALGPAEARTVAGALKGCLCGSAERHVAQFSTCGQRREHSV
jgi:hypothetical protein